MERSGFQHIAARASAEGEEKPGAYPRRRDPDDLFAELQRRTKAHALADKDSAVRRAYILARTRHEAAYRLTGEPYIVHPLEVGILLAQWGLDAKAIAAGLLHDVVEDTRTRVPEVDVKFGEAIGMIVDGVSKVPKDELPDWEQRHVENFRRMFFAMVKDVRVLFVKLADRLNNLESLDVHAPEKSKRIARETLFIYAPLANWFSMSRVRRQLEDRAFPYAYPRGHAYISQQLAAREPMLGRSLEAFCEEVRAGLAEDGISAQVIGRTKRLYSIWASMARDGLTWDEIDDLLAVRVIVTTRAECDAALESLERRYVSAPEHFRDYITNPRPNAYQSLHAAFYDAQGSLVFFQIRTQQMHLRAEEGVVGWWNFEELRGISRSQGLEKILIFLRAAKDIKDLREFVTRLHVEIAPGHRFLLTWED